MKASFIVRIIKIGIKWLAGKIIMMIEMSMGMLLTLRIDGICRKKNIEVIRGTILRTCKGIDKANNNSPMNRHDWNSEEMSDSLCDFLWVFVGYVTVECVHRRLPSTCRSWTARPAFVSRSTSTGSCRTLALLHHGYLVIIENINK